jgi:hypothetical protein
MNQHVSVLFTGQIRDRALFERSLAELSAQPCVTEIVLATWHHEALADPGYLRDLEQRHGLRVATASDPGLDFDHFNGIRQSVTLRRGLDAVRERGYVFKTRTDCHIDPAVLAKLAASNRTITDPAARRMRIFREKVSVPSASPYVPLYLDDKMMFGRHEDLMRLAATDLEAFRYPLSPRWGHYIRFSPPFLADFPMFRDFLRYENMLGATADAARKGMLLRACAWPEYLVTLLAYYRLVSGLFCLDWGGHSVLFQGANAAHFDGAGEVPLDPDIHCNSNDFFLRAGRGEIDQPALGPALREVAARVAHVDDPRDLGNGMDFAACWSRLSRSVLDAIGFDRELDAAKKLLAEGKVRQAFEMLLHLRKYDPFNLDVLYQVGRIYASAENWKAASYFLRNCLELGERYDSPAAQLLHKVEQARAAEAAAAAA